MIMLWWTQTDFVTRRDGDNMQAKVKWFNNVKGYGFIEQDGKEDIFIHYANIEKDIFLVTPLCELHTYPYQYDIFFFLNG